MKCACGRKAYRKDGKCRQCGKGDRQRRARSEDLPGRLREAAIAMADADSEDDDAYRAAVDAHRKAADEYGAAGLRRRLNDRISAGMLEVQRTGTKLGRPVVHDLEAMRKLVAELGFRGAASVLGLNPGTVWHVAKRGLKQRPGDPNAV